MYGLIFRKLQTFSEITYGKDAWAKWLKEADIGTWMVYMPDKAYPDEDIVAIVTAAAKLQSTEVAELLEAFGVFIAPELLHIYPGLIKAEWKTLDLIEHTEKIIHAVVRKQILGAHPPRLEVERLSPTKAVINYRSARRMCALVKGIARGLSGHYEEKVTITEEACMSKEAEACRVVVEVVTK